MTCPKCNKLAQERDVATKTREIDGHVVVLAKRRALVCDKHGVLAWDPPIQVLQPWVNPVYPQVPVPSYPFPRNPFQSGGIGGGYPRPQNVCSTASLG